MVKSETEEVHSVLDDFVSGILFGEPAEPIYRTTITEDLPNSYSPTESVGEGSTPEESQERASEKYRRGF